MNKEIFSIDIILPVYHEEKNIQKVLHNISSFVKTPHNILLIFQDKIDPTISRVTNKRKNLYIYYTNNAVGLLPAIKKGLAVSKSNTVVVMMSDLSDDAKDIDKMVKKIREGYDLVCASRYIHKGKRLGGPKVKGFLSMFACLTLQFFTGVPTRDATNAFKCFRKKILENITIESKSGYEFPLEITIKSYYNNAKITEIPTVWKERKTGYSKFNFIDLLPLYIRWYMFGIEKKIVSLFHS